MSSGAQELGNLLELMPPDMPGSLRDTKIESNLPDKFRPPGLCEAIVPTSSPNLFWTTGPPHQQFTNFVTSTYALPDFGFPQLPPQVGTTGKNIMNPIDVRKLLGNSRRFCQGSVGATPDRKVKLQNKLKPRGKSHLSLSGLSPKLVELGVSKRLIKLENLNSKPEKELTIKEKDEKTHLLRLEKKRKAAVVCRERKKKYVQSLEERSLTMSKHVAALEKQNEGLRALLSLGCRGVALPPPLPPFKPTPLADKPRCYHRRMERAKKRNILRTMEKLYLSSVYVSPGNLDTMEKIDLPPLCSTNSTIKSKRLRLV